MSVRKKCSDILFRAVCLSFSTLLLVLSLLADVRMTRINDRAAALKTEIAALKTETEILLARCESSVSMETLERYALQELGMQPCRSEQIVYIELK